MCQDYGNPSSMHRKGVDAEHYVKEAKETIAKVLKVNAKDIYFTSGGTESDNLALIGCARANRRAGNHLITTSIEHPAILNTMRYLEEEEGFRVTYLPVDASGRVNLEALEEALCPETILVSVMYVNNEVGTLQPIDEAVKIVKEYNSSILFHSDAVQGFGKYHGIYRLNENPVDMPPSIAPWSGGLWRAWPGRPYILDMGGRYEHSVAAIGSGRPAIPLAGEVAGGSLANLRLPVDGGAGPTGDALA